jgi:RNA polymerase-binding transcription factor DksA
VSDSSPEPTASEVDFDVIERDLAAVETALQRLSDGTYWIDEVTGEPIPEHVLAADPTARRA